MNNALPRALRALAAGQAGLITRAQALKAGMPLKAVKWRLKTGDWRAVHPGVYTTTTGPLSREARLWAAVLAAGPGAYLSHETAAELDRLTDDRSPVIHVTIPASRRAKPPPGVKVHRSSRKAMTWRPPGVPPYSIAEQTILDLAQAAADRDAVVALVTAGFSRGLLAEPYFRAVVEARKKVPWRGDLDDIITMAAGGAHSVLKYRHDRDVQRAHGLPEPVKQAKFRKPGGGWGYRDRCYPRFGGLIIELDGARYHPGEQRGQETERDNAAAVTGATLRYGWDAVTRRPCETARQEAAALRHRGWTGTLIPCSPACRAVDQPAATSPAQLPV